MNAANDGAVRVFNIGVEEFRRGPDSVGAEVHQVDWRPPLDGDPHTADVCSRLLTDARVDDANAEAVARILAVDPTVIDVIPAAQAMPGLSGSGPKLLHAGPPIAWASMCGPMKGALIGAVMYEGWAGTADEATALLARGHVGLEPCHHHGAVGPMSGVISPSMPVWVVEDPATGRRSFSNLNEGLGKVLRFGAYEASVLERLNWMATELAPVLSDAIRSLGGIALRPMMAQALHMGDEVHNRNAAATGQLLKRLAAPIAQSSASSAQSSGQSSDSIVRTLQFIGGNDHFFLNLSMAACKLQLDAASGVPHSTLVTAMARNGVNFGIRVSGLGNTWFEAPASMIEGLYFAGFGPDDANPDLGDSAITETAGLGGFAMAAAPAIVGFVGGTSADALAYTLRMREICVAENPVFTIPSLGFRNTGLGIDIRLVIDTGILPVINTGIAHREAGIGQIGAGITTAPFVCFTQAASALVEAQSVSS